MEGKRPPFNLALLEANVLGMTPLDTTFDPAAIITWEFKPGAWHTPRDWGSFS